MRLRSGARPEWGASDRRHGFCRHGAVGAALDETKRELQEYFKRGAGLSCIRGRSPSWSSLLRTLNGKILSGRIAHDRRHEDRLTEKGEGSG